MSVITCDDVLNDMDEPQPHPQEVVPVVEAARRAVAAVEQASWEY